MPAYRFSISNGHSAEYDPLSLPNDNAAWQEAVSFCGQVLRDELRPSGHFDLEVTENDRHVFSIAVRSA
jgi:hypothetical protein